MLTKKRTRSSGYSLLMVIWLLCLVGCTDDNPLAPLQEKPTKPDRESVPDPELDPEWDLDLPEPAPEKALTVIHQVGTDPPTELVTVDFGGENLTFWPYTGNAFDGASIDPINLIFTGEADPVQIRDALLSLDGDRSAYGFPPVPPFAGSWEDCVGGTVQTTYVDSDEGWLGSVVQLSLGQYDQIRFHLRLFRTGQRFGQNGEWTLGGAHFEVMIPGTADHQVLSWELAQQLVMVDLLRSGLLDVATPIQSTGLINAAPSYREIPAEIYNVLPADLLALIGGPPPPVAAAMPLASDGAGTILNLSGTAPRQSGTFNRTITIEYGQFVPRPFCSDGPYDYLYVTGPVEFTNTVQVTPAGRYSHRAHHDGELTATPIDITTGNPCGETFSASVWGRERGRLSHWGSRVLAVDKRLTRQAAGPELQFTLLHVKSHGRKTYRSYTYCLDDE